jgi:hypothetical protein
MIGCATLPYLVFLVRAQGDPAHRSMRVEF